VEGKVIMKNNNVYTSYKFLEVKNDSIKYLKFNNSKSVQQISVSDIDYVKLPDKGKIGIGILFGGLIGALPGMILPSIEMKALEDGRIRYQKDEIIRKYRPTRIVGVLIGGLIGATITSSKKKKYYLSKEIGMIKSVKPDIYFGQNSVGLTLRFNLE